LPELTTRITQGEGGRSEVHGLYLYLKEDLMLKLNSFLSLFILISFAISSSLLAQGQEQVEPVNWRELAPFIIEIPGWKTEGKPEGSTASMGNFKISQVERNYSAKDKNLKIEIVDGAFAQMVYAGFKMAMGFEIDTSEEYIKKATIKGFPGVEEYNYEDKEASVMVLVADRFLVSLEQDNAKDTSELKAIAEKLDLKGLAKLVK